MKDKQPRKLMVRVVMVLLLLAPISIGAGFGYLSWKHSNRLLMQFKADLFGNSVLAEIISLEIIEIKSRRSGIGLSTNRTKLSYFCDVQVEYELNNQRITADKVRLEDEGVCRRYKIGDEIAGKIVNGTREGIMLDEGRLPVYWVFISFLLFILFALGPIYLVIRGLIRRS